VGRARSDKSGEQDPSAVLLTERLSTRRESDRHDRFCGDLFKESAITQSFGTQIFIATAMVALTVVMHLLGLSVLIAASHRHSSGLQGDRSFALQIIMLVGVSFGLFILHGLEIWTYAALYYMVGAIHSFEDALYFSTATYATMSYGELTLSRSWRILGAIEGANGVILLGWSTAFFISIVGRIRALEHDWFGAAGKNPQQSVRDMKQTADKRSLINLVGGVLNK
jgi:voltage-gated potassium channel